MLPHPLFDCVLWRLPPHLCAAVCCIVCASIVATTALSRDQKLGLECQRNQDHSRRGSREAQLQRQEEVGGEPHIHPPPVTSTAWPVM